MKIYTYTIAFMTFFSVNVQADLCSDLKKKIEFHEKRIMEINLDGDINNKTVQHESASRLKGVSELLNAQINLQLMQMNGCKYDRVFNPASYIENALACSTALIGYAGKEFPPVCDKDSWQPKAKK